MPGGAPQDERPRHDDDVLQTGTTQTSATDALRLLLDDVLALRGRRRRHRPVLQPHARGSDTAGPGHAGPAGGRRSRRGPGVALTGGPGIVVERELAAAARLLDEAAEAAPREPWEIDDLLVPAERLQAQLAETGRDRR